MSPKSNMTEELIIALRDPRVMEALAGVFEAKLQPLLETIDELKTQITNKSTQIVKLQSELHAATSRIEALETYTRRDNLLISGLPVESYVEAAGSGTDNESTANESVERSVLKLFNEKMGVAVKSSDISIAHRLKKRNTNSNQPPVTIVRFANRKAREAVYTARRRLRDVPTGTAKLFINEDLNKTTAELFYKARQLIRQKVLYSTWTSSCSVYVKDTADPNCRPRKIASLGELPGASSG